MCLANRSTDLPYVIRAYICDGKNFFKTHVYVYVVCRKCTLICRRSWSCKSFCVFQIVFLRNYSKGERCISVSRPSTELIIIEVPVFVIPLQQHEINHEINPMFRSRVNLFTLVPSPLTPTESKSQHQIAQYKTEHKLPRVSSHHQMTQSIMKKGVKTHFTAYRTHARNKNT